MSDPRFLAARLELQVDSICLTHRDDPRRTAAFLARIADGTIRLVLSPGSERAQHALRTLGVDLSQSIAVPAPPRRVFHYLRPPFWRGTLAGKIQAVRHARPEKLREFHRAWSTGLIDHEELWTLSAAEQRTLAMLGVPFPDARESRAIR